MRFSHLVLVALMSALFGVSSSGVDAQEVIPCDATCTDYDEPGEETCVWAWSYDCVQCTDYQRQPTSFGIFEGPWYEGPAYGREYCNGNPTHRTAWDYYYCGYCPVW